LILLARIVFIGLMLVVIATQYQGKYVDLLLSGTTPFGLPDVPDWTRAIIGIVITSTMLTASLLAPFTATALNASLGMAIGTLARGRLLGLLGQVSLVLARVVITAFALELGAVALSGQVITSPFALFVSTPFLAWLGAFIGIAEGDMGLSLLFLPSITRLWADREYGVMVGVVFLIYTLGQAALANVLVKWAGRRAAKADAV
jgi:hypothetical protein